MSLELIVIILLLIALVGPVALPSVPYLLNALLLVAIIVLVVKLLQKV